MSVDKGIAGVDRHLLQDQGPLVETFCKNRFGGEKFYGGKRGEVKNGANLICARGYVPGAVLRAVGELSDRLQHQPKGEVALPDRITEAEAENGLIWDEIRPPGAFRVPGRQL
jgi:hypothetical protein